MTDRIELTLRRDGFRLDVGFDLPPRGVLALLGPSGCGKSSLLRCVAGLEPNARGRIRVAGNDWLNSAIGVDRRPQARRAGMVFQDYALFEHMTVAANVGFGVPRRERKAVAAQWLKTLHLDGFGERFPRQLSGGQRQRVALARALAHEPDMLLLDEPLSAIDVHLRQQLRTQLQAVFIGLTKPVILVSHDLEEARQLADWVGVLVDGRLHRIGPVGEVFNCPGSVEAARVLGWRNLLPVGSLEGRQASGPWGRVRLAREPRVETAVLGIRAEKVSLLPPGQGDFDATVVRITELGAIHELQCRLRDGSPFFVQRLWSEPLPQPASTVGIGLPLQHLIPLVEGPLANAQLPLPAGQPDSDGDAPCQSLAEAS